MRPNRLVAICLAMHTASFAASPDFSDFPAKTYHGPVAKVRLLDAKSRQYGGRLRDASHGAVNFAGHQILATWGCGASCIVAATIDAKTGEVAWLPFTVCCWDLNIIEPLEFRPDSRLLIVHGSRNEIGPGSAVNYYTFDVRSFSAVHD